ncbi:MAG: polysaccharide deacetylase family protein [Bacteroidales bacterium]
MLLIYAPYKTARLTYVLDYVFHHLCFVHYNFTFNKSDFDAYNGAKIAYTSEAQQNCAWMYNCGLLFEKEIKSEIPPMAYTEWGVAMFKSESDKTIAPFDVFAAIFWFISRYEEYIVHKKDNHQRFDYRFSWAFKHNVLQIPIVNKWGEQLCKSLKLKYPSLNITQSSYRFIPSFDVDNFFAFKGKTLARSLLAMSHALVAKRLDLVMLRLNYLIKRNDPYDTYDYIIDVCKQHGLEPYFFILTGKTSEWDRNLKAHHPLFINMCKKLAHNSKIGLHLSYNATIKNTAKQEKMLLEQVTKINISINRFHFLRFSLPQSYQMLVNAEIKEDYSMSYASIDGYRAGTCTPFYFYDLENDKSTDLLVYPMPFIDKTLINSLKLDTQEAMSKIETYIRQIKMYNGVFVSLWHNETLQNNTYWNKWRMVFEWMIKEAVR